MYLVFTVLFYQVEVRKFNNRDNTALHKCITTNEIDVLN